MGESEFEKEILLIKDLLKERGLLEDCDEDARWIGKEGYVFYYLHDCYMKMTFGGVDYAGRAEEIEEPFEKKKAGRVVEERKGLDWPCIGRMAKSNTIVVKSDGLVYPCCSFQNC